MGLANFDLLPYLYLYHFGITHCLLSCLFSSTKECYIQSQTSVSEAPAMGNIQIDIVSRTIVISFEFYYDVPMLGLM